MGAMLAASTGRGDKAIVTQHRRPIAPPGWFVPGEGVVVAQAPGRLDVLGGIADYSGATVLELPLGLRATVAVAQDGSGELSACTGGPATAEQGRVSIRLPIAALLDGSPDAAPERLREALLAAGAGWATYVLGPLAMLRAAGILPEISGLRLALWSEVPIGAGLSSSAALEVASLRAFQALFGIELEPLEAARLAQQSEHRVALAPCGIMDQVASLCGERDKLLILRCQPAAVLGHRTLPDGVRVLGIDSGVAHRVAGDQYGRVRIATFMGRAIIAALDPADPPGGYLCSLSPERFHERYERHLPAELQGAAFRSEYGETGDDATRVDPDATYRVRDCTTHPVLEQRNVSTFLAAIGRYVEQPAISALEDAGAAMLRSHRSYGDRCGLGTPETDMLVELLMAHGSAHGGIYGAKITGGGGGGTVAVLGTGSDLQRHLEAVAVAYTRQTGNQARVVAGSGDGALALPPLRLRSDSEGGLSI